MITTRKLRVLLPLLLAVILIAIGTAALYPRQRIPILMYHHLVADGGETNDLTITESKFRRDMEYLRAGGYTALSPEELDEILRGARPCPEKPVVISFDDGYRSNYALAYPILRETGQRAVIALITANIRETAEESNFMLAWPEIEEMAASGTVFFGSHTDNLHNPETGGMLRPGRRAVNGVRRLPEETQEEYAARVGGDIARSCRLIEAHTGAPVRWFAYPYGVCDRWCEAELDKLEVPVSVLTNAGYAVAGRPARRLPRFAVHEGTELSELL